jgi:hypothetical protein
MNKTTNLRYYYTAGFCWLRILTVTAFLISVVISKIQKNEFLKKLLICRVKNSV